MSRISELQPIRGDQTKSNDLFVTVNLEAGDIGTKNITRNELVNAIQEETFTNIKIDGGDFIKNMLIENSEISESTVENSTIITSDLIDPNISVSNEFIEPIEEDDYFYLRDASLGDTVAISYSQLYNEISETAKKANKVYVAADGNDEDPGSYLKPVATIEKALKMADAASEMGIATSISVLPGDYYTNGNLALPDLCSVVSTNGQYSTKIIMNPGFEKENAFLLGSGCYVQGFSFFNLIVDNFDYPSKGFAFAFRPGARIVRSPYIRDCSQISNYFAREIPPLLNPVNKLGTIDDLGFELEIDNVEGEFEVGDTIKTSNGVTGVISNISGIEQGVIYIRNNVGHFESNTAIRSSSGGLATILEVGDEDYPNRAVGRGGGMILADRSQLDQDSIFPYVLAFGATPRTQNGLGYVAKNGAGINGISSLSIFARCAFYSLDGGQITLNNSGTQFGDISMRAKGSTPIFNPKETEVPIIQNEDLANDLVTRSDEIIDDLWDYLETEKGFIGYDSEKCRRDVGLILDGVGLDIALGTNYWAIVNGIAYRRAESSVVINEQLSQTTGAIEYLRDSVEKLISKSTNSVERSNSSFDKIIDILNTGESAAANVLSFSSTGNDDFDRARTLLLVNRTLIQNNVLSWATSNFQGEFDTDLCRRDVGFILDALAHDLNYNTNLATILNARAYFIGSASVLPADQKLVTAEAIRVLGQTASQIMTGEFPGQSFGLGLATPQEASRCIELTNIISRVIQKNSLGELPARIKPDLTWVDFEYKNSRKVINENRKTLQRSTIGFVNSEFNFLDENLTRRDAANLITSISNDFKFGTQTATRIFVSGLFNFKARHVFSVFNPSSELVGLNYIDSVPSTNDFPDNPNIKDAVIVYDSPDNFYIGSIFYWDGNTWIDAGENNTSILDAFVDSWNRMKSFIKDVGNGFNLSNEDQDMIDGLFDDILVSSTTSPRILRFGSLVESLSHQFNLASAGVNVNALPLNFRRLGQPISAAASVLQEDGGRVRWSGADELNNQYFARGLRINGRTGRLEGRPFTSSVRKLARRASNSRASI